MRMGVKLKQSLEFDYLNIIFIHSFKSGNILQVLINRELRPDHIFLVNDTDLTLG
jgi:hypothetical protein